MIALRFTFGKGKFGKASGSLKILWKWLWLVKIFLNTYFFDQFQSACYIAFAFCVRQNLFDKVVGSYNLAYWICRLINMNQTHASKNIKQKHVEIIKDIFKRLRYIQTFLTKAINSSQSTALIRSSQWLT